MYARFLYSFILVAYYINIPQDILENDSDLDLVSEVLQKIGGSLTAVYGICEAANNAFNGFFMGALRSDPEMNLALSKFDFYSSVSNALIICYMCIHACTCHKIFI